MNENERENKQTNDARALLQKQLDDLWRARQDEVEEHRNLLRSLNEFGLKIW
jgi:hypothetical protein